ncbi:MAG: low molecular weight phosphotyrosine protein phosphatase [Actinobacteria bacterium]|nr:low molecular weight phosphotyrosine protein phosphatase [Actinomycetota bacterium]
MDSDLRRILVVCTANICRSPMFEGLLRRDLGARGSLIEVESAGLLDRDEPADPEAVSTMAERGVDISGHRSRAVARLDLDGFDLILTMGREHLREIVIDQPELFPVTFTVKSFARALSAPRDRADRSGARDRIRSMSQGRSPSTMLGESPEDDVDDPYRLGRAAFEATATELSELSLRISSGLRAIGA